MVHRKFPNKRKTHLAYGKRKRRPQSEGTCAKHPPKRRTTLRWVRYQRNQSSAYLLLPNLPSNRQAIVMPVLIPGHQTATPPRRSCGVGLRRSACHRMMLRISAELCVRPALKVISKHLHRTTPSLKTTPARLQDVHCHAELYFPSTSGSGKTFSKSTGAQLPQARDRQRGSELPSAPHPIIQAHIQPTLLSAKTVQARA